MNSEQRYVLGPYGVDGIDPVISLVLSQIQSSHRTLIRLHGDLGAGKTFLVSRMLHAMGLSPAVPVQSPTFALMHEYKIGKIRAAHLDLYRLSDAQDLSEVTGADFENYSLVFVEWSDRMAGGFEADLVLDIRILLGDSPNSRTYEIIPSERKNRV